MLLAVALMPSVPTQTYPAEFEDVTVVTEADVMRDAVALARSSYAMMQQRTAELEDERHEHAEETASFLRTINKYERTICDLKSRNVLLEAQHERGRILDSDVRAAAAPPEGDMPAAAARVANDVAKYAPRASDDNARRWQCVPSTTMQPAILRRRSGGAVTVTATKSIPSAASGHVLPAPATYGPVRSVDAPMLAPPPPRASPY